MLKNRFLSSILGKIFRKMFNDNLVLQQKLLNADSDFKATDVSAIKLLNSMRYKSMAFYNRLSLMSGGILSLSITYIGYLSSIPNSHIMFAGLLFVGWIFLLMTIIGGIYRNHFNLDMGHYQVVIQLTEKELILNKSKLEILQKNPSYYANLDSPEKVGIEIDTLEKSMKIQKKALKKLKVKEKLNSNLWVLSQNSSHIGFVVGLLSITFFASLNLPVSIDFTLFNLLFK